MKVYTQNNQNYQLHDSCPICHSVGVQILMNMYKIKDNWHTAVYRCPDHDCNQYYLITYETIRDNRSYIGLIKQISPKVYKGTDYSAMNNISSQFNQIYSQAEKAEKDSLTDICGMGYRKSLEFLLIDYAKYIAEDNTDKLQKIEQFNGTLGKFITSFFDKTEDLTKLSIIAKELGNDETHYKKKYNQDIGKLKKAIKMVVDLIQLRLDTAEFLTNPDMPEA